MIGIDEVGRGCWAGPLLVVAARDKADLPPGLRDSKVLSRKQRLELMDSLIASCQFGEGWVQPEEIDRLGLSEAMKLGVSRSLSEIQASFNEPIVMDGSVNYCAAEYLNIECVVKADAKFPIVSAASIYAKVRRDQIMIDLAKDHPDYGFENHVGYGTAEHSRALLKLGTCKLHRQSFKPMASMS